MYSFIKATLKYMKGKVQKSGFWGGADVTVVE